MNDFMAWFLVKHWLISSFLFPEIAFAWAVWQKYTVWACVLAIVIAVDRALKAVR